MKLSATIDLDEVMTSGEWGEAVGSLIKEELRAEISKQIRKEVKSDAKLKRIITEYKNRAINEALNALKESK